MKTITTKDFNSIDLFLKDIAHIDGVNDKLAYNLLVDYMQIINSDQPGMIPSIVLFSKEPSSGKSAFIQLIQILQKNKIECITPDMLLQVFNWRWAQAPLLAIDGFSGLKYPDIYLEKVKDHKSGKTICRTPGVHDRELHGLVNIIFVTNEESLLHLFDDHRSYTVFRPRAKKHDPELLIKMEEEAPLFLSFLNNRKIKTQINKK